MADVTTPRAPGSMTVPLLHGWEDVVTAVALVVAVAIAALLLLAAGRAASGRSEWQAWPDGRSTRREDPMPDGCDLSIGPPSEEPLRTGPDATTGDRPARRITAA
jgi:hypothetical protein